MNYTITEQDAYRLAAVSGLSLYLVDCWTINSMHVSTIGKLSTCFLLFPVGEMNPLERFTRNTLADPQQMGLGFIAFGNLLAGFGLQTAKFPLFVNCMVGIILVGGYVAGCANMYGEFRKQDLQK
jgi:hypothetical protein